MGFSQPHSLRGPDISGCGSLHLYCGKQRVGPEEPPRPLCQAWHTQGVLKVRTKQGEIGFLEAEALCWVWSPV